MDNLRGGSSSYSKKRGQVTIFILIGLVLVMSVAVVMYISEQTLLFKSSKFLPGDVKPAAEFIEQCIEDAGKEAINLVGLQGGYVYLPEYLKNNPSAHIKYIGLKIPYWYLEGRDSSPSIELMQEQISQYIDENVESCVNNLSAFSKEYNVEIPYSPVTQTILAKEDVLFETDYHIILKDKNGKSKLDIDEFKTTLPVAVKKVYELGQRILEKENQDMFLEEATINLMAMDPGIPFTGLNFECVGGPMQWKVSDISNNIKDAIKKDIPRIRVKNTNYIPFAEPEKNYELLEEYDMDRIDEGDLPEHTPVDAYDYFHYFWDLKYNGEDLRVGFNYHPEFGSLLNVRPSENGIMKSNVATGTKYLDFLCLHLYHFSYDLTYPVEVIIRDDYSYNGDGFVMRFAMPIMIDHNYPNRKKITQDLYNYIPSNFDYSNACDEKVGEYEIVARGYDEFLYESELDDVMVYYDCLRYKCYLGNTSFEGGSSYSLETGLPKNGCVGGFILTEKEGYLETSTQVLSEGSETIDFWIPQVKTFNYSIVTQKYDVINQSFGLEEEFDGMATIYLTLPGYEFEQINLYGDEDDTIDLLVEPAKTYSLEIILTDELGEEMIGGYKGNWTLSYEDMKDKNTLVFRTMEYWPAPITDEDKMNFYLAMFGDSYQGQLKPRFEE